MKDCWNLKSLHTKSCLQFNTTNQNHPHGFESKSETKCWNLVGMRTSQLCFPASHGFERWKVNEMLLLSRVLLGLRYACGDQWWSCWNHNRELLLVVNWFRRAINHVPAGSRCMKSSWNDSIAVFFFYFFPNVNIFFAGLRPAKNAKKYPIFFVFFAVFRVFRRFAPKKNFFALFSNLPYVKKIFFFTSGCKKKNTVPSQLCFLHFMALYYNLLHSVSGNMNERSAWCTHAEQGSGNCRETPPNRDQLLYFPARTGIFDVFYVEGAFSTRFVGISRWLETGFQAVISWVETMSFSSKLWTRVDSVQ